jgi:hypothetical protein
MQFSIFYGGANNTKPEAKPVDLAAVIKLIKHDAKIEKLVEQIRLAKQQDPLKGAKLKTKLPYITPYGLFSERKNEAIQSYNYITAIDIDKKDNPVTDMGEVFKRLCSLPSCILAFKSPSGNGVKGLVKVPDNAYNQADHYEVYKQVIQPFIEKQCGCKIDQRQGVLSQPLFLTHDKDLYYNPDYTDLQLNYANVNLQVQVQTQIVNGKVQINASSLLQEFCLKIQSRDKNKWEYFNKISILVAGMYMGGQFGDVDKYEIISALQDAAKSNPYVDDYAHALKQINSGFDYGLQRPVTSELLEQRKGIDTLIKFIDKTDEEINNDHVFNNNRYIRVGDDYFELIESVSMHGKGYPVIEKRSRQTLMDDFGKAFLKEIPKFKSFCNVPDYINYKPVVKDNVNLFAPFTHKEQEGIEYATIEKMLRHIFGAQYEMGLDYIQLLYQNPTQILPVLCLVSKENATGKTSFLEFLEMLFKGNTAIISTNDIEGDFNQHYISKHIIMVDESDLHKNNTASKIKQMATQKTTFVKGKFQNERKIDFYGKLILVSNDERSFLSIKDEDIRYWIRKVPKLDAFDAMFNAKVEMELPGFVYFLNRRELETKTKQSRAWFSVDKIETEWTKAAKEANRSDCFFALLDAFLKYFSENQNETEIVATVNEISVNLLTNSKYNARYIGKTLRDEFKIEYKSLRAFITFDSSPYKVKHVGKHYRIERDYIYKEFVGEITDYDKETGEGSVVEIKSIVGEGNKQTGTNAELPPFLDEAPF